MSELRPLLVRMPTHLHAAIASLAKKEDKAMAQLVRQALREYIVRAERRARREDKK